MRQLNQQLLLINLSEYQTAAQAEFLEDEDPANAAEEKAKREVLEKTEGLEALLGSVATYAAQTQALFLAPTALVFVLLFSNETMIP